MYPGKSILPYYSRSYCVTSTGQYQCFRHSYTESKTLVHSETRSRLQSTPSFALSVYNCIGEKNIGTHTLKYTQRIHMALYSESHILLAHTKDSTTDCLQTDLVRYSALHFCCVGLKYFSRVTISRSSHKRTKIVSFFVAIIDLWSFWILSEWCKWLMICKRQKWERLSSLLAIAIANAD